MEGNGGGRSVDVGQVNDALNAKGVPVECAICGRAEWNTTNRLALVTMDERPRSLDNAFEAVCMVCTHCGFVRLHAGSVLFGS
jgi:hypothetical protein